MKKIYTQLLKLSLLILFTGVFSLASLKAQTATPPAAGAGTYVSPYEIASLANLYWISANTTNWNKHYIQTANIDASATSAWNAGTGWMPLGNSPDYFTGCYNGADYYITNLYINRPGSDFQGLFGLMQGSIIENIHLVNANINGGSTTGALVASMQTSDILRCSSTGTVTGKQKTGGLVGYIITGYFFQKCFSSCTVTGEDIVGGLVGAVSGINIDLQDSYAQGSVTATKATNGYVGGLVGRVYSSKSFTRCYSKGLVTGATPKGGLVGDFSSSGSKNFWDTETSGVLTPTSAGTGKTTAEMKSFSTYSGATWDIGKNKTWGINSAVNNGYPFLSYQGFTSFDVPSVTTQTVTSIVGITATANGTILQVGSPVNTQHGHCWATTTDPTIANFKTELGSKPDVGGFTSAITDLIPVTIYYVRSYITNSLGTFYGASMSFISGQKTLYITGDFTANNKAYNGITSTAATINVNNLTLSGILAPYTNVFISAPVGFEDGNAGDNKRVYILSPSLTGADAGKYTVSATGAPETTANITKKPLYVSAAVVANKVYNGTTDATISGAILHGIVMVDDVSIGASVGTFADKRVGPGKSVTAALALTGAAATNYYIVQPEALTANITAKPLTVSGASASNKVYNGTTAATITGASLLGVETGDVVSTTSTGTFANKTVGTVKPVTASLTLTGVDAGNYSLTQPTGLTANITAKALTVSGASASNKVYNSTTAATITGASLSGIETGDVVSINTSTGTFANKTVGTGKPVTAALTLTGAAATNYTVTQPLLTATITAKQLSISGTFTADDKTFNGTNAAVINQNNLTLTGVEGVDAVNLTNVTAQFNNATIGNSKPVSITNSILAGADKDNYTLTLTGAPTTTASIVAMQYAVNVSKTGNGTTSPAVGSQVYNQGSTVSLSATPAGGYSFVKWVVNGVDNYNSNINLYIDKAYTVEAVFSIPTSVNTVKDVVIEAFPNPTSGLINIKSNKIIDYVSVASISGKMFEPNLVQNELTCNIDLRNYLAGVYILKIKSEGNVYFIKVLKQ